MNKVCVRNVVIGEGMPKICAPVVGRTREEILFQVKELLEAGPDLAEWRADWFEGAKDKGELREVLGLLRGELGEMPLLVTFRTKREGGEQEISAEDYEEFLGEVLASGQADLVDVELFMGTELLERIVERAHEKGVKVAASSHDFEKTPNVGEQDAEGRGRSFKDRSDAERSGRCADPSCRYLADEGVLCVSAGDYDGDGRKGRYQPHGRGDLWIGADLWSGGEGFGSGAGEG